MLIIIPTKGHFDYAGRAVDSCLASTEAADAVIVDDASGDWSESWVEELAEEWPGRLAWHRFEEPGGLTRSWNWGLAAAKRWNHSWAVCGNSDLVFSHNWWPPMESAIQRGWELVGPLSNAPGPTSCGVQDVSRWHPAYRLTDVQDDIDAVGRWLAERYDGRVVPCNVNGFCMAASVSTWHAGSYNPACVFDPRRTLTGNEDELQRRWRHRRRGAVLASFVFHYRAVTRGHRSLSRGWYRPPGGVHRHRGADR